MKLYPSLKLLRKTFIIGQSVNDRHTSKKGAAYNSGSKKVLGVMRVSDFLFILSPKLYGRPLCYQIDILPLTLALSLQYLPLLKENLRHLGKNELADHLSQ